MKNFLDLLPAERLLWLKENEAPENFLDQLESELAAAKLDAYADLSLARREWTSPGANHRLLLEHLALVLPTVGKEEKIV